MGAPCRHLLVDLPAQRDGVHGQAVQAFGLGGVGVRQAAVAQQTFGVVADTEPLRFGCSAAVIWSAAEGSSGDEDEAVAGRSLRGSSWKVSGGA